MGDKPPPKPDPSDLRWPRIPIDGLGEEVVDEVSGLGATLALTPTRVVVVRQGASFRPISGVRSWPYRAIRAVQLSPLTHGSGRIVLRVGLYPWQALSVFIDAERWPAAERIVGQIRTRVAEARRVPPRDARH
jgi:hypothetical protein